MSDAQIPLTPNLIPLVPARKVRTVEPDDVGLTDRLLASPVDGDPISIRVISAAFIDLEPNFDLRISGRDTPDSRDPSR